MSLDECFTDGQPQAGPARMLLATMLRTVEALKYVRQLGRSDARPIIRHRNNNPLIKYLSADAYFTLAIRQRINDQIVQHNLYTRTVYVDRWQGGRNMRGDRNARVLQPLDDLRHEILYPGGRAIEEEQPRLLPREIEQVVDKLGQAVSFAANHLQEVLLIRKRPGYVFL